MSTETEKEKKTQQPVRDTKKKVRLTLPIRYLQKSDTGEDPAARDLEERETTKANSNGDENG